MVSLTLQIKKTKNPKGNGLWKLNTSILNQKNFKQIFQHFWKNWQTQKTKYKSINQWWETGKIYFKVLAVEYSKNQIKKINQKQQKLTNQILKKKKILPNKIKIETWLQELEDIEIYRIQGTIIRSKENVIINQEQPNKFFLSTRKTKIYKKTNKATPK